jgi:hypothetical protein
VGWWQQQAGVGVAQQPLQRAAAQVAAAARGPQREGADLQRRLADEQLGGRHAAVVGHRVGVGRPAHRRVEGRAGGVKPHAHLPHRLLHAGKLRQHLAEALVAPLREPADDMAVGGLGGPQEDAGERRPRPVGAHQEADRDRETTVDHALRRDLQVVDRQDVAAGRPHAHRLPVAEHPNTPLRPRDQEADRLAVAVGLHRGRQEQVGRPRPAGEERLGPCQAPAAAGQRRGGGGLVPPVAARLRLGEATGEDGALADHLLEERLDPVPETLRQQADPVQVHVDRKGGRRRALGEPALGGDQVEGARPHTAEVGRDGDGGVAGGHQVVEVLVGEPVGLVVAGRPPRKGRGEPDRQVDDLLPRLGRSRGLLHAGS